MASIVKRNSRYCVVYVYYDEDGNRKQKWETYTTMAEAKRRKSEIEYHTELGNMTIPNCKTLSELLDEYVQTHGKSVWALSTYNSNVALIEHYIRPNLGTVDLSDITPRVLEKYYQIMLKTKAVPKCTDKKYAKKTTMVSAETVRRIHKLLHSCFEQAVRWELIMRNPAEYATVPKSTRKQRDMWTADVLFQAIDLCEDPKLKLAMNLAFSCSLRIGELLALTWSCVDISPEAISDGAAYVYVNKEIQRVSRAASESLKDKDVIFSFPVISERNTTKLVLKKPKTESSVRKIFLPRTVAEMLVEWKKQQDEVKEALGSEFTDYDLIFAGPYGTPTEASSITDSFRRLIKENDLPKVVFHSLRHSSITYKLKLNGGDIKAVQGDSGHSQAKMVTDQYSHIIDEDRKINAELMENVFYQGKRKGTGGNITENSDDQGTVITPEMIAELMKNPAAAAVLTALLQTSK